MSFFRLKNKNLAKLSSRFPLFAKKITDSFAPLESEGVPWALVIKPLAESKVAIVTTAGVHHRHQPCFDMNDPDGDPTFRAIDVSRSISDLIITHDYYDHSDADKDINVVFPIQRLWELKCERFIGEAAKTHFGFMGHITGRHIQTLLSRYAPEVAQRLETDGVDVALLTPG